MALLRNAHPFSLQNLGGYQERAEEAQTRQHVPVQSMMGAGWPREGGSERGLQHQSW